MRKKLFLPITVSAATFVLLAFTPLGTTVSQELQDIRILNFPDTQRIEGTVSVDGPVRAAELRSFTNVTVPPVQPEDTTRLIHAGTLDADGYGHVVLSLLVQARGESKGPGSVGAILVPDEATARRAFLEIGQPLASLRFQSPVDAGTSTFFGSQGGRQPLAFPRYQVFLYNTTETTVSVNLHAYVSSG